MPTRKIARYGWRPDHPDRRDFKVEHITRVTLPTAADVRMVHPMPDVYDQGELGSCTANAIAAAIDFERGTQGMQFLLPSRLFIYFEERAIEGNTENDGGAEIRDGIKVVASLGACPEQMWPYDVDKFANEPTVDCYAAALAHRALRYSRVPQNDYYIRHELAIEKKPIVFGFTVYESFESSAVAQAGVVPMPAGNETPLGGHAVLIVGYDDTSQRFTVRNSWGADWGKAGYFTMPYRYVLDPGLADDFWTISLES